MCICNSVKSTEAAGATIHCIYILVAHIVTTQYNESTVADCYNSSTSQPAHTDVI